MVSPESYYFGNFLHHVCSDCVNLLSSFVTHKSEWCIAVQCNTDFVLEILSTSNFQDCPSVLIRE